MDLVSNKRLYDLSVRHQAFVEGVKAQYAKEFNDVLLEIQRELNRILGRVKFKTLDGLTKAELRKLVIDLRNSQSKTYNGYTQKIIKQLTDFMNADLSMNRRIYTSDLIDGDDIPTDKEAIDYLSDKKNNLFVPIFGFKNIVAGGALWSVIKNQPIPANGLLVDEMIDEFTTASKKVVEMEIRKGYANKSSVDDVLVALTSESKQGTASVLERIKRQAETVIDTAVQHITSNVSASVQSAIYKKYRWHSVLDSRTSDICLSRNGHIYEFGSGVLPPAHYRCRSSIVPIGSGEVTDYSSIYDWGRSQPANVQRAIFGEQITKKMADKDIKNSDLPKYRGTPLTIAEYSDKIETILQR